MLKPNKILLAAIMIGCLVQAVEASSLSRQEIRSQNKAYLQKMGITLLDGEVRIVKATSLIAEAKDDYYSSRVHSFLAMHKEQEQNGFVEGPEPRAKELLDFYTK